VQWRARRELVAAKRLLTQTTLQQAAAEAARTALQRLASDDEPTVDHERKPWAAPQLATNPAGIVVRTRVTDENRFFDWNNLAIPPLGPQARSATDIAMDLMNLGGDFAPLERLEALTDWLDDDPHGLWETPFYRQQIPSGAAANRPLYTWNELLLVHGFSRDLFRPRAPGDVFAHAATALLDSFTVAPVPRERPVRVNVNTASREVLLAVLGVDQSYAVQALLALREGGPIRSLQPIRRTVEPRLQAVIERYLDVRSLFFRVEAEAEQNGQTTRLRALARRGDNGGIHIVQWLF
jgi:type II secretory pathway component PulK